MAMEILVKGARVHNLKNIDVRVPLNKIVGIAGVSGSGKSSLALGVLYAEGARRYLESLSTYTRRRMSHAARANVDEVRFIPAALALPQRPGVPGIRSTFGTSSELLNSIRLMYSRLAHHKCPNGHYINPSILVAADQPLVCPVCNESFLASSAEDLAFNSQGACRKCGGTGVMRAVDKSTLVPNEDLTIEEGAVAPWNSLMWSLMTDVCREMGVRTNVPFRELTKGEKDIVYYGPAEKKHILYKAKTSNLAGELDFTYYNAIYTVENALAKVKDEKGMKRIEKFLVETVCDECHGSRLSEAARSSKLVGLALDDVCKLPLCDLVEWVNSVPGSLPADMRQMAENICESFRTGAERLIELGLGYLSLDRSSASLSTGERQRVQLARVVRNRTTGVLYVLDEPSIGLHPANVMGLINIMHDLISDGNSIILVDHDPDILKEVDWLIEMGPGSGSNGGRVIAEGSIEDIRNNRSSIIRPFLSSQQRIRQVCTDIFEFGTIKLSVSEIHTVKPLSISIPKGRLTVVTGVSGSGKTTLILESLVPALKSVLENKIMPAHIQKISVDGINHVKLIDATPIGINVRSTVATYTGIHDELRKLYAGTNYAKQHGYKAGDFSYNTGKLRCPVCDGTGTISLDVQFLPDVEIQCSECLGTRYKKEAYDIKIRSQCGDELSLPNLMSMEISEVLNTCRDIKSVSARLQVLQNLGLGYLTLGEETPGLSGGEAQRLKLASEMGRSQVDTIFIFDEPTIGLHPLDVQTLLNVFQTLIDLGGTVVVIEHDLDVIRNADYIIDMGPGGGNNGGEIVACGSPDTIKVSELSVTGRFL